MDSMLKEEVFAYCGEYVAAKLENLHLEIERIREGLQSEAKSTAGDKHETGRAMLQLEREKLGHQLLEVEKMKKVLERISIHQDNNTIALGSLVETDKGNYFISISAGKFQNSGRTVFCISTVTPIGKLLLGKSVGDAIPFNGTAQTIIGIY